MNLERGFVKDVPPLLKEFKTHIREAFSKADHSALQKLWQEV
jgi:hypothetical protein